VSSERKVMVSGLDPTWSASVAASDLNSNKDDMASGVSSLQLQEIQACTLDLKFKN